MARQKSEDREVPEGRRKPVPTRQDPHGESPQDDGRPPLSWGSGAEGAVHGGGKAVPVEEVDRQLLLPFATAEHLRPKRRASDLQTGSEVPKAKDKRRADNPAGAGRGMEAVVERLEEAFEKVAANRGAPGPDRQTIEEARKRLPALLANLRASLLEGSYRPGEIRRVWIPKAGGGQRGLGIPNVSDRVVQEAIRGVVEPLYEPSFHSSSHGFRPNRSCHSAIAEARSHVEAGFEWVVDLDLEKFFDRVHHQRLMARLALRIADKRLLALIGRLLKAQVVLPEGVKVSTEEGVPQGGPLSPLLSNIVLSELDEELARRGLRFVRYADDCNVYVRSERAGQRVKASVTDFIRRRLRLTVNEAKSAVARPETRHFLGYRLVPQGVLPPQVVLSERSEQRIREKIRELTPRASGRSLSASITRLNEYLTGWLGHFRVCTPMAKPLFRSLDAHIRRRLRAIVLRHWKTKRTIALRLIGLGIRPRTAWRRVYEGRMSLWALAHAPAVDRGLCNAYFAERGLVSLLEQFTGIWSLAPVPRQLLLPWDTPRS